MKTNEGYVIELESGLHIDAEGLLTVHVPDVGNMSPSDWLRTTLEAKDKECEERVAEERVAWLDGKRCYECGNEKELSPLSDTCPQCWENN